MTQREEDSPIQVQTKMSSSFAQRFSQPTTWHTFHEDLGLCWPEGETIVTAGEDWPDAYRYTPMNPEESRGCVVVFWHKARRQPVFQVYHGLLFGLPLAVTFFNRWSKFGEAMVRRLLILLFSMYFDDAIIQDWASTGTNGQAHSSKLMELVGFPWSPSKSQPCSSSGDFWTPT